MNAHQLMPIPATNPTQPLVMTSREIAELTGKQHQHVKRDIEKMLSELGEDVSRFGRIYIDPMNRQQTEYALDRELTETLLTGYSAVLRRKVIARWRELEEAVRPNNLLPDFTDPVAAARAWADALELAKAKTIEVAQVSSLLAIAAPKAIALDRIAGADGTMCITDAAKALQMQPSKLFDWMQDNKWIFRRSEGAGWTAYQQRINAGLLVHKVTEINGKARERLLVTANGLKRLSELVPESQSRRLAHEDHQTTHTEKSR